MAININNIAQTEGLKDNAKDNTQKSNDPWLRSFLSFFSFRKRVKAKELMFFTAQISLLLETGHSLNRSLEIINAQVQNPYFKMIINQTMEQIERGKLFSEALEKHSSVFSSLFISVVKVGETGGFLRPMMKQLADYYQQREEYLGAVRKALIYPAVLLLFACLVLCFVMVYVFPRLALFLEGKEAMLPWSTRFFMGLSHFLRSSWYLVIIALVIGVMAIKQVLKNKLVSFWLERQRMKIPVLKNLLIQFYTSYFLSNLGFLLNGGVPILEGLMVTKSIVRSSLYQEFIQDIIENVEKGGGFSAPFRKYSFLPPSLREMIQTGEETGNLNQVIKRLGEYYAQEFRKGVELFCTILEPLIVILMGGVVGLIVLSIIIPIFRLSSGIH